MRKSIPLLLSLLVMLICQDAWSFTLIFKDGSRIEGTWMGETESTILVKDSSGKTRSYHKSKLDMAAMTTSSRLSVRTTAPVESSKTPDPKSSAEVAALSPSAIPAEKPEPQLAKPDPKTPEPSSVPEPTAIRPTETLTTPALAKVSTKRWSMEGGFSNVYENNIHHDEEDIVESVGVVTSLSTRFKNRATNPDVLLRYEIGYHQYTNTDQWDRISHNMKAAYLMTLGRKFLLENNAEVALNGSSEDRELGDQYGFRPVLNYNLTDSTQIEVFGAYRYRKFDTGFSANNRYAGAGFAKEISDHKVSGYYRYEVNDSQNPLNDRNVATYYLGYTLPMPWKSSVAFGARLRNTKYKTRLVDIEVEDGPDIEFLRNDRKWNFQVALAVPFGGRFELVPEYEYEYRTSNDPEKFYNAHEASLSLVYVFW